MRRAHRILSTMTWAERPENSNQLFGWPLLAETSIRPCVTARKRHFMQNSVNWFSDMDDGIQPYNLPEKLPSTTLGTAVKHQIREPSGSWRGTHRRCAACTSRRLKPYFPLWIVALKHEKKHLLRYLTLQITGLQRWITPLLFPRHIVPFSSPILSKVQNQ